MMASGYIRGISAPSLGIRDIRKEHMRSRGRTIKFDDRRMQTNSSGTHIQNVKAARIYVFGNDNFVEEDENVEFEMPEIRSRQKGSSAFLKSELEEQPEYFEKEIDEGETLQAIALKYACAVSDLKRLNNLIQDQEFFALKVVKVPMKKFGILSEQFPMKNKGDKKSGNGTAFPPGQETSNCNYYEESDSQHDFSDPDTQMKVMRTLSIQENVSSQGKEAEQFLCKMDADLAKLKQSSRAERESLSEVISVLTNKALSPLQTSRPTRQLNGATCGISWRSIVLVSLIVAIVVPAVLFYYIKYGRT